MADYLVIHLLADGQARWLQCDNEGQLYGKPQLSVLSDIPKPGAKTPLIVIVPSDKVTLYHVDIPETNRKQQLQAVPFALEEELPGELERYVFSVLDKKSNDGKIAVAVVLREHMQAWLDSLEAAGFSPQVMLPELLALHYEEGTCQVYLENGLALVRTALTDGFVLDAVNLNVLLKEHPLAGEVVLTNMDKTEIDLPVSFSLAAKKSPLLAQAVKTSIEAPLLNLLQGEYRAKKKKSTAGGKKWFSSWTLSVTLVVILILVFLMGKWIKDAHLHHARNAQNQRIEEIYKQNFPQATQVTAPRERMQEKLEKLRKQAAGGHFLDLLDKVGTVFSQYPGVSVASLQFDGSQLIVTAQITNLQWQQGIVSKLQAQSIKVDDSYKNQLLTLKVTGAKQ